MDSGHLQQISRSVLHKLCVEIPGRSVGSEGNRAATKYFQQELERLGWQARAHPFEAMDWEDGGASLTAGAESFTVSPSPYSRACRVEAPLVCLSSLADLEQADITGCLVLLHGGIASEQIMPKNFVFYNPEEHQRIIALLESKTPAAVICATGRNSAVAGGVYPFPLIEDGDFDIPSVYMTEEEGLRLLSFCGQPLSLVSDCHRIPGSGWNITARRGNPSNGRVVVSAHIDAKRGTPGALDNASGIAVLLLLAALLRDYDAAPQVEILALNGEDYYAVPGQMLFLRQNEGRFHEILLDINIDGAGYYEGPSAFSFYNLPGEREEKIRQVMGAFPGIAAGPQWVQSDHSMFVQCGVPAVAVTSAWFSENMDSQTITHTPQDTLEILAPARLVEIASALEQVIRAW